MAYVCGFCLCDRGAWSISQCPFNFCGISSIGTGMDALLDPPEEAFSLLDPPTVALLADVPAEGSRRGTGVDALLDSFEKALLVLVASASATVVLEALLASLTDALLVALPDSCEVHIGSSHQEAGTFTRGPSSSSSSSSSSPSSSPSVLLEQSPAQKQGPEKMMRHLNLRRGGPETLCTTTEPDIGQTQKFAEDVATNHATCTKALCAARTRIPNQK